MLHLRASITFALEVHHLTFGQVVGVVLLSALTVPLLTAAEVPRLFSLLRVVTLVCRGVRGLVVVVGVAA